MPILVATVSMSVTIARGSGVATTAIRILLIPGAGNRMAREFAEYRPWKNWAQFDKEIGKYVGAKEVARLWRYVTIQ